MLATLWAVSIAPAAPPDDAARRALGGAPLLRAAEHAPRVALGTIEEPGAIDRSGWAAWLRVERELAAPAPTAVGASGAAPAVTERVRIGWEEVAPDRPPRFAAGERVLVALEPLPGWSLWRQRFPKHDALAVAADGQAFLRGPTRISVDWIARWRALLPADREAAPGTAVLAGLIAGAEPPLAEAALARLGEIPGLAERLDAPATAALSAAITDTQRPPELRLGVIALVGAGRIEALRPALPPLAEAGPPWAAAAWQALAELDGGLPVEVLRGLLDRSDPGVRAVAVAHGRGTPLAARVARLAREDAAPEVRAAAVRALVVAPDPETLELGFALLADPAAEVRAAAARAVGAYGADVVPRLRAMAEASTGQAASGPMGALSFAGPAGSEALIALSRTHPDPSTRQLARLFAGLELREH